MESEMWPIPFLLGQSCFNEILWFGLYFRISRRLEIKIPIIELSEDN